MSIIITTEQLESERQAVKAEHERLQALYNSNMVLAILADQIHNSRMLGGPACDQCIDTFWRKDND